MRRIFPIFAPTDSNLIMNITSFISPRIIIMSLTLGLLTISCNLIFGQTKIIETEAGSNLPVIFIDTQGQTINQDNKIVAVMKVLNHPSGINHLTDSVYEYNGLVGMKIRGNSSTMFPKKSFTVETQTIIGTNNNVSLLGMPRENDWIFHGPYSDKSLMRNVLAYHLGNKTGKWSPRTMFFELYLNGQYNGIYVLVEKIKIDKNRLDLAKYQLRDTAGNNVTGGFILKIDRPESTDVENEDYWFSPYRANTRLQQRVPFIFHHPKGRDLNAQQKNYIRNHITSFEDAIFSNNYMDKELGYRPYIDLKSFVEYYIITELSRNLDGYRISTFIHKDRDSRGGKITMGPYWDYNICFGNANFFNAGSIQGWVIDGMGDGDAYAMPFWWEKFRLDPIFNSHLKRRWNEMKVEYLNTTYLNKFIDSCAYVVRDAQVRNFQKWDVLGRHVWPNNYVGGSYSNEINYLKTWLRNRINWMDSQIQQIVDITLDNLTPETMPMELVTYPNPFIDQVNFKFYLPEGGQFELEIRDVPGKLIYTSRINLGVGIHLIPVHFNNVDSRSRVFIYQVKVNGVVKQSGKLIR